MSSSKEKKKKERTGLVGMFKISGKDAGDKRSNTSLYCDPHKLRGLGQWQPIWQIQAYWSLKISAL